MCYYLRTILIWVHAYCTTLNISQCIPMEINQLRVLCERQVNKQIFFLIDYIPLIGNSLLNRISVLSSNVGDQCLR